MSAEHDTEAAESARRIVEYWAARGVKDPSDCKARHLDELRVALSLLSRVETAREEAIEERDTVLAEARRYIAAYEDHDLSDGGQKTMRFARALVSAYSAEHDTEAVEAARRTAQLVVQLDDWCAARTGLVKEDPEDTEIAALINADTVVLLARGLLFFSSRVETARDEVIEECKSAALSRRFGPPSGWALEGRPERWHLQRLCTPTDASMHDNGCIEAAQAVMALRSLSTRIK